MRCPEPVRLPRRTALALGGAALALPFLTRSARAEPIRWILYTVHVRGSAGAAAWQRMADRIKAGSQGALEIAIVTAGRLGVDVNAISQAVISGAVMLGDDSYYAQLIVAGGVPRLPLLVPNRLAFTRGAKAMRTYLKATYDVRNGVLLGYTFTPRLRTWSKLKFDSFAGLANRRIRATSPEQGEFVRLLAFADPPATPWRALLKAGYEGGPNHLDSVLVANKTAFQALPKPLQDLLVQEAAQAETDVMDALFGREDAAIRKLADDGLELAEAQTVDTQTMTQRMTVMWDEWTRVRGREAQDLLFAFRGAMETE
jgi:TRAP-type C4-dicarboxylate transport system substrate-binding protein